MQQQQERVRDKALRRPRFKIEHLQVHQEGTKKKKNV